MKIMNLNEITADKLHNMNLSERAAYIVADTDINIMYEVFGGLETPEEVEAFIEENYKEV